MRIIVIDDGISREQFDLPELAIDLMAAEDGRIEPSDIPAEAFSHGTVCAAILCHYLKLYGVPFELGSIRVLNVQTKRGEISRLLAALEWCMCQPPCILHMSIGTELQKDMPSLHHCIRKLRAKGFIIVSARSNHQGISYPACFSEVVGVRTSQYLQNDCYRPNPTPWDGVDYLASGIHTLKLKTGEDYSTYACNSYAAPLITAQIAAGRIGIEQENACVTGFGEHFGWAEETAVIVVTGEADYLTEFTEAFCEAWLSDGYQTAVCNDTELAGKEGWFRYVKEEQSGIVRQLDLGVLLILTEQLQDIAADYVVTLVRGAEPDFADEAAVVPAERGAALADELQKYIVSVSGEDARDQAV